MPKPTSQNLDQLASRLNQVKHFAHFSDADRQAIVQAGKIEVFTPGATIFREGEPSSGMFVLLSGHVHLYKLGPRGQRSMVSAIDPVIMFNEITVLDGDTNLVTAVAMQDSITWCIRYEPFQALMRRFPEVGLSLLHVLAARTRYLMSRYEDLSFRSVLARTAKLLLDLSRFGQQPISRLEHRNRDMAAQISTVPEALSRSLNTFKKTGDIVCSRSTITVCAPETLAKLAGIDPTWTSSPSSSLPPIQSVR